MFASTSVIGQECAERALSPRQAQIAVLVARGKSSREIGLMFYLSPRTVDVHVAATWKRAKYVRAWNWQVGSSAAMRTATKNAWPILRLKTNLPLSRSSLVGRQDEIAEIADMVRVWLAELAPLARGELVPSAVARMLELQESRDPHVIETLVAHAKGALHRTRAALSISYERRSDRVTASSDCARRFDWSYALLCEPERAVFIGRRRCRAKKRQR